MKIMWLLWASVIRAILAVLEIRDRKGSGKGGKAHIARFRKLAYRKLNRMFAQSRCRRVCSCARGA